LAVTIADSAEAFTQACDNVLNNPQQMNTDANRNWLQVQFNWKNTLAKLPAFLEQTEQEPG
ncbi:MAG: hypothetical protein V7677_14690, partial [Motiliproteus sp.]